MTDNLTPEPLPPNTDNAPNGSGFRDTWPDAAIELLTAKWAKGVSARTIAEMLSDSGHVATKNSVLGKARRLGLGTHPKLAAYKPKAPPKHRLLPLQKPGQKPKAEGCRYIDGEPDGIRTLWCDDPVRSIGEPYCTAHASLCYREWDPVASKAEVRPQRTGAILLRTA